MSPGSSLTLSCVVGVVDGLIAPPNIMWIKHSVGIGSELENGSAILSNNDHVNAAIDESIQDNFIFPKNRVANNLTLHFISLNTSNAGQYTCVANISINAINLDVSVSKITSIQLQSESWNSLLIIMIII